jgi:hypothetical protein
MRRAGAGPGPAARDGARGGRVAGTSETTCLRGGGWFPGTRFASARSSGAPGGEARDDALPGFAQRTGSHDAGGESWKDITTPNRAGCAERRQILEGFVQRASCDVFYPRLLRVKSERMMRVR